MTIEVREWDGSELINGINLLDHPNPVQKAKYKRIIDNGGKILIGEEDGSIVYIQGNRFGKSGFITAGNIDDEKLILENEMKEAKVAREAPVVDDDVTKKFKALSDIVEAQGEQISALTRSVSDLVDALNRG